MYLEEFRARMKEPRECSNGDTLSRTCGKCYFKIWDFMLFDLQLGGIYSEYSDGFAAAAQSVYYENSSACILPISADDGSTMLGIARFVEKYDLKKVAVAGINTGGVQNTRLFILATTWSLHSTIRKA